MTILFKKTSCVFAVMAVMAMLAVSCPAEEITLKTIMPRQDELRVSRGVVGSNPGITNPGGIIWLDNWDWKTRSLVNNENALLVGSGLVVGGRLGIGTGNMVCKLTLVGGSSTTVDETMGITAYDWNCPIGINLGVPAGGGADAQGAVIGMGGRAGFFGTDTSRGDLVVETTTYNDIRFSTLATGATEIASKMVIKNTGQVVLSQDSVGVKGLAGSAYTVAGNARDTDNNPYALYVIGQCASNGWAIASDMRLKKDIAPIDGALDKILKIRGVSFEWDREKFENMNFPKGKQLGIIAQEIAKVFPEIVSKNGDEDGYKTTNYDGLIPVLIEAMKEQQKEINTLKREISDLKGKR